jgi:hypothetical protein
LLHEWSFHREQQRLSFAASIDHGTSDAGGEGTLRNVGSQPWDV